ncbi:hypothetical protein [Candidatus Rhodoluna planktonica]|uniref:PKD domain-containing protein n=1 Tax=Candidatus Rhodoluna planktonica TaxID=535712 RepID=A0A1D9DZR0_9MICO|nr:hypothetical protein [Candidatus Rhodoluna planktonica]AOY56298.1 hypothetical protein A4Z71_04885 [Candidatus Rhodoluna planktonica]
MFWQKRSAISAIAFGLCSTLWLTPSPSSAADCVSTTSGLSAKSKISNQTVTVCASARSVQPARSATATTVIKQVPQAKPKTTAKPAVKPKLLPQSARPIMVDRIPAPVKKPTAKVVPKAPAKKPIKVTQISTSTTPGSTSAQQEEQDFNPTAFSISSSAGTVLSIGEWVSFTHDASAHQRTGLLLGKSTTVEFLPVGQQWQLNGYVTQSETTSTRFVSAGTYLVSVAVTYSVYATVASVSTRHFVGNIVLNAHLEVEVGEGLEQSSAETGSGLVRLVDQLCLGRTDVFGCD